MRRSDALVIVCCVLCSAVGCAPGDEFVDPPPAPSGSSFVTAERIFGGDGSRTSVDDLVETSSTSLITLVTNNGEGSVGAVDESWTDGWRDNQFNALSALIIEDASGPLTVAVGNNQGSYTKDSVGVVATYNSEGTLLDSLVIQDGTAGLWLNDVMLLPSGSGSSQLVAVGAALDRNSGVRHPYSFKLDVAASGGITAGEGHVFDDLPNASFHHVQVAPDGTICVSGPNTRSQSDGHVWLLTDSLSLRSSISVGKDITAGDLIVGDGDIFVTGFVERADTIPREGFVGRYGLDGLVVWKKKVGDRKRSDALFDCALSAGRLYVVGSAGEFWEPATRRVYGQAQIVVADAVTGSFVQRATFGKPAVLSRFNAIVVSGGKALCGGFTDLAISQGRFKGWYVTVDLPAMEASPGNISDALAEVPSPPTPVSSALFPP